MVFRKRSDGLAIRDIDPGCRTVLGHSSTCCYSRSFYREQEALAFPRGSLRQTEGTQDRCAATEDYPLAKFRRAPDAKRTPCRERSRSSRAARNQKGSASPPETAVARRIGTEQIMKPEPVKPSHCGLRTGGRDYSSSHASDEFVVTRLLTIRSSSGCRPRTSAIPA